MENVKRERLTLPSKPLGTVTRTRRRLPAWIRWTVRLCFLGLRRVTELLLISWATLVIYYSNLPWAWSRFVLATAFAVFAAWALWVTRPRALRIFAVVFLGVVVWFVSIPPSHDRPWRREVAVMPRAIINGDRVLLKDFRHFKFRSRDDFDVRYEQREVSISHIVSIDLFISYWKIGPVAHTFISFNFDDGTLPVCISVETRPEVGEGFDPLRSLFKQFELIYVVGDERDIVGVRANHRNEDVFLYHLRSTPGHAQRLFRIYLDRINELADRPEWYHLLSNQCTLNVLRYSRAAGGRHRRFDHRHLLNGLIDRYLYGSGVLDTSLEFEELRRRSHINEVAQAADDAEDFSARIRASLPPRAG